MEEGESCSNKWVCLQIGDPEMCSFDFGSLLNVMRPSFHALVAKQFFNAALESIFVDGPSLRIT